MTSNYHLVREHGILCRDRLLDKGDWSFKGRPRFTKECRKPLPSPLETRLALQSRLIIAEAERKAWVEANRDKIIAAARAEVARKLNNN
jgi:hypothetical protein